VNAIAAHAAMLPQRYRLTRGAAGSERLARVESAAAVALHGGAARLGAAAVADPAAAARVQAEPVILPPVQGHRGLLQRRMPAKFTQGFDVDVGSPVDAPGPVALEEAEANVAMDGRPVDAHVGGGLAQREEVVTHTPILQLWRHGRATLV
jgi:hypothetical protein